MRISLRSLTAACVAAATCAAFSKGDAELEQKMLQALRPVPNFKRQENAGAVIREYKAAGVLPSWPTARVDYTDYYLAIHPTTFLANELVLVEEEYMTKFAGCCVDEGAGVFVRITSDTATLEKFARKNLCRVDQYPSEKDVLAEINVRTSLPTGRYASLRCHVRDEEKR